MERKASNYVFGMASGKCLIFPSQKKQRQKCSFAYSLQYYVSLTTNLIKLVMFYLIIDDAKLAKHLELAICDCTF